VRYRLRRIADLTGRDPRRLADMIELISAARLVAARTRTPKPDGRADQSE
jgi:sugar diacid utilization regulator